MTETERKGGTKYGALALLRATGGDEGISSHSSPSEERGAEEVVVRLRLLCVGGSDAAALQTAATAFSSEECSPCLKKGRNEWVKSRSERRVALPPNRYFSRAWRCFGVVCAHAVVRV